MKTTTYISPTAERLSFDVETCLLNGSTGQGQTESYQDYQFDWTTES